jgi:hypothetical protein
MIQNFTPNDVLLANSGELSKELSSLLQLSLQEDSSLQKFSEDLQLIESEMEHLVPETDEKQIQAILHRIRSGEIKH